MCLIVDADSHWWYYQKEREDWQFGSDFICNPKTQVKTRRERNKEISSFQTFLSRNIFLAQLEAIIPDSLGRSLTSLVQDETIELQFPPLTSEPPEST